MESALNIEHVKTVTRDDIINYLSSLYDKGLKSSSVSRNISAIKTFHKFLFLSNYSETNPGSFVEQPRKRKIIPKVLALNEVETLISSFSTDNILGLRNKTMVELMYSTGLRVSELVNLNIEDLNLGMGFIKCVGKGRKERIIPIGCQASNLIREYLEKGREKLNLYKDKQILFFNRWGHRISRQGFWKILKRHAVICNLSKKISPHNLRHTFATHLLKNDVDIRYIQELLGHSNISTTQIYTKVETKKLQKVINTHHPRGKIKGV